MKATFCDVSYGPHERNVLDIYLARQTQPSPLFFWIHGGGFYFGDKSERAPRIADFLVERGISVIATNYRFSTHAIYPAPYLDCRRALPFSRYHASSWGLDPNRVALGGLSAGAGMALWLGFRSDMANPHSQDPIERESTRPRCIYSTIGQTSYDPRFIRQVVGGQAHMSYGLAQLFGVSKDRWPELDEEVKRLVEDGAAINFLDSTAPPVLTMYDDFSQDAPVEGEQPEWILSEPNAPLWYKMICRLQNRIRQRRSEKLWEIFFAVISGLNEGLLMALVYPVWCCRKILLKIITK